MKEIILTGGYKLQVDDEDYGYLSRFTWTALPHRNTVYAVRVGYRGGENKHYRIHRVILGVFENDVIIDHLDGNGLNNQKANLRLCTAVQNRRNSIGWGESKSPGVTRRGKKWIARIRPKGNHIYLGSFDTEEAAAEAYKAKADELYGEYSISLRNAI